MLLDRPNIVFRIISKLKILIGKLCFKRLSIKNFIRSSEDLCSKMLAFQLIEPNKNVL